MNETVEQLKNMQRAMVSYVYTIYEIVLESKPEFILEIGTGQAQSTRVMLSALKENNKGILVSIDNKERVWRVPEELKDRLVPVLGDSHREDTLLKLTEQFKTQFDLLLIDGDHSYEGVKKDFEMYVPLVKEGGLILMHDICNKFEGVKDFWKEIKYPKIALQYGRAAAGVVPGLGIVQIITQ